MIVGLASLALQAHVGSVLHGTSTGSELRWQVDDHLRLVAPSPQIPGSLRGDRIVALDGQELTPLRVPWNTLQRRDPGPVEFRLERAGASLQLRGALTPRTRALNLTAWLRFFTGLILVTIGLVTFLLRPGAPESWHFLAFCLGLGVLCQLEWISPSGTWNYALQWSLVPLVAGLGVHLFAVFPSRLRELAALPRLAMLFYAPTLLVTPPCLSRFALGADFWAGRLASRALWPLAAAWAIVGLSLQLLQLVRARRASDPTGLALSRALVLATGIGLTLPVAWIAAVRGFGLFTNERWVWQLSITALAVFAGMTSYVLVRHNPLKVDRFTAAVLGYAVTVGLMLTTVASVLVGLSLLLGRAASGSPLVHVLLTAAATVTISPLYRRVKRRVDLAFSRDTVDPLRSIEVLQRLVEQLDGKPRGEALEAMTGSLRLLQPDGHGLWLLTDEGGAFRRERALGAVSALPPADVSRAGALGSALQGGQKGGIADLSPVALSEPAQEELYSLGLAMVAPVLSQGAPLGFLGVGRRLSGGVYPPSDLALLTVVASHVAAVLGRPDEGARIGRYRIERRLGVGGMAEVFLAWQLGPGGFERRVALKRPLPELAEDPVCGAMFLDEARIAARLQHRNIAQVYEIDRHAGSYFIAMEYIDGPALRAVIRRATETPMGHVPLPVVLAIATGVLHALEHAHQAVDAQGLLLNLVHRDVTPANVLLTRGGEPKLVDFGIARAGVRLYKTQTGLVRGTLPYMSPEAAQGEALDARADLFSAAAVIYELLTLHRAFPSGPTDRAPPPASSLRPDVPSAVDEVLARAFSRAREARPATAMELLGALTSAFGGLEAATDTELGVFVNRVMAGWEAGAGPPPPGDEATARLSTAARAR